MLSGGSAALLAEKVVGRKGLGEPGTDHLFDRTVGDADEVLRSLGLADQIGSAGEIPGREFSGLADHRGSGCETLVNRHGRSALWLRPTSAIRSFFDCRDRHPGASLASDPEAPNHRGLPE